jgi:hypothetical protein
MRWVWHVALLRRGGISVGFWWEDQREKDRVEDVSVGGRIKLTSVVKNCEGEAWTELM